MKTGLLDWDERCKQLFGLPPDAHIDYDVFLNGLHPDDRERVDQINKNAMADGADGRYDCEYRTIGIEDRKLRWIRARGRTYFDSKGKALRFIGTVLEVTERREQQQRLSEREQLFRLLVTSIPQIVWTTDVSGKTDYISDRWEYYTGIPKAEAFPGFTSAIHSDDLQSVIESWNESLQQGASWSGEYRLLDKRTNEYSWFAARVIPLKDENGTIFKWIGSAGSINDQKLVEQELEKRVQERTDSLAEMNKRLQQSNRELEQFAYVASHDLQEPLRKVSTYLGFIKNNVPDPENKLQTYFQKIDKSISRMGRLIRNLLDYSKLDKDQGVLEDVDLDSVVTDVLADFELAITQKAIHVEVDKLPAVKAVPHQMTQLFYNLIGNAIKFSKSEGERSITIAYEFLPNKLNTTQGVHRVSVADNGIGFDQKYASKMFEIFERLHTEKAVGGHGIGLAICQKIVKNHNGTIWAMGTSGQGAVFFVELPQT
jgi:two-component system CheB/CheR fusion protein